MVNYDGTVRDCHKNIIQFLYGEDGMSGDYVEDQIVTLLKMNDSEMERNFRFFDLEKDIDE